VPPEHIERKLAAILAADVSGYSRLMSSDEEGTLMRLKSHRRELIDPKITEHNGRICENNGRRAARGVRVCGGCDAMCGGGAEGHGGSQLRCAN